MTDPYIEPEPERRARIRENVQRLLAAGIDRERISRYLESERITPEMEAAREPLGAEDTIRGALANAGEGIGFSFADELMGGLRGIVDPRISMSEGIDQVRAERDRFAAAHPKTALGLNLGGAVLPAILTAGASTTASGAGAAPTLAQSAARVAASGAGGGALAGYGSGEGGMFSGERLARGAAGGAVGGVLGAVLPGVAGSFRESVAGGQQVGDDLLEAIARRSAAPATQTAAGTVQTPVPFTTPTGVGAPALRAAGRALGDPAAARANLARIEAGGMGDEALAMNVGGDRAVRAVRAAANTPDSDAGQLVNERLARQGGALGAQVPRDIGTATGFGTAYPEVTAKRMQDELAAKVEAGYEAFRNLPDVPLDPTDPALARFIEQYVNPVIRNRYETATATNASALSGRNVDAAFKNLQREVRGANAGVSMGTKGVNEAQGLESLRDRVLAAIAEVDPNYAELGRTYALDADVGKVAQEAFERGRGIRSPGEAVVAMEETARVPGAQKALRAGDVARLQEAARGRASNPDLGDLAQFRDVARAVVGNVRDKEQFIALHGQEAYDNALALLMPKVRAAAQNAAARGNSTTTKQLLDALAFGDDAMLDALNTLTTGGPGSVVRNVLGRAVNPAQRALRLGIGRTATETADLLTTKGAGEIRSLLDLLEALGIEDAARKQAMQPVAGVAARATATGARPR